MAKVQLLDATLRDGGQGLYSLYNDGLSDKYSTEELKHRAIQLLDDAKIDIVELGVIEPSKEDKSRFSFYQTVEELSRYQSADRHPGKIYAGLYTGPDTDPDRIPAWDESLVEGVRVVIRYSELRKSLDYCAALARKGYKVFVQPMLTMRYSDDELALVLGMANDMGAYACYFVDSFGYMGQKDIYRLFSIYDKKLGADVKIGFHTHNNMNMAYANALTFLGIDTDRELLVDACVTGMGQGAGNLQTELIVPYLNQHFGKEYDYDSILDICEHIERDLISHNLWGYSVTRLLPAVYKTAYKYALIMREKHHLSYRQINKILRDMPLEMRFRYTKENMDYLLTNILWQ